MNQTGGYRLERDETMSLFEFPASSVSLNDRLRMETASIGKTKRKATRRARKRHKRKTRRK
jgi:hypothetical protein